MILAFNAIDSKTKELIWTKSYNSENLYRKQLGVDPTCGPGAKEDEDIKKPSTYALAFSVGWHLVPNVKTSSNMLGLNIRVSEQFNLKKSEVGAMLATVIDPALIVSNYSDVNSSGDDSAEITTAGSSKATVRPFKFGLGMFATYHHNFITVPENYEVMRYGMHLGLGGIYAPGYITVSFRGGMILKFGKHFFLEGSGCYSMPTTLTIKDQFEYKTKGGVGADATFGVLF